MPIEILSIASLVAVTAILSFPSCFTNIFYLPAKAKSAAISEGQALFPLALVWKPADDASRAHAKSLESNQTSTFPTFFSKINGPRCEIFAPY